MIRGEAKVKGPRPRNGVTMPPKERQAAYRARQKAAAPGPKIVVVRKPLADRRSRPQRWRDAVEVLLEIQEEYQDWLDRLPPEGGSEATREALETVCGLDVEGLEVELPRGFGLD